MKLPRSNKKLEQEIIQAVAKLKCPIHQKSATVSMPDENEAVKVEACCVFFRNDIVTLAERMRKDFLYKAEKTRERLERERRRSDPDAS
jgi:hypothetical protein